MAGVKIVDLPALGRDLISTDLLEVSLNGSGSRKITGQEIMNASKLAIGSTPIVAGTVGRLLFQGTGDVLQQSSNLFWDNPNLRLGIGISTPLYTLDVAGNIHGNSIFAEYNIVSSAGNVWLGNGYAIGDWGTGNNRIEFYSNRLSFFGNGNEALRIVGSTGNLLVNTVIDAGYKLDVNGTARVQGLIDSTNTFNSLGAFSTGIGLSKTTLNSSTNFSDVISVQGLARSLNNFAYRVYGVKGIGATDGLFGSQSIDIITGVQGSISVGNGNKTVTTAMSLYASAGTIGTGNTITNYYGAYLETPTGTGITNKWGLFQQDTTSKNYFGGNVLINTTTDAGYKLDVNGDTKTLGLLTAYGISTNLSDMAIYNTTNNTGYIRFITQTTSAQAERMRIANTGNVLINTTTDAGYRLDVNGTARVSGNITATTIGFANTSRTITFDDAFSGLQYQGFGGHRFTVYNSSTAVYQEMLTMVGNQSNLRIGINSTTPNASAILDVASTNKGFLPPRMTNAQRAAIASPAVGLIVYCTDATEGLYVYKSTGWTFMV